MFENGFESRGTSTDIFLHTLNNASPPSNFVPTSISRKQALEFASNFGFEEGFLYTLRKIPGIDVNKELGMRSKHKNELEIAIPGRIDTKDILGASPVNEDGTFKGYTILNPNRKFP
ncbi:scabin-related ADP-ribosyltransferase [Pseudomonas synxantha]|uniref:scabin-related ADP-ribosyltransferase n=1 Tax=Pseudomonas synxantha TaxID=47883 RepID=UPI000F5601EF|nr:enterotoxin A family protein [Pseudomonas synxantha]